MADQSHRPLSKSGSPVVSRLWKKGQPLSCSDCSRLKLKCSRLPWPCEACKRRGKQETCPAGSTSKSNTIPAKRKARGYSLETLETAVELSNLEKPAPFSNDNENDGVNDDIFTDMQTLAAVADASTIPRASAIAGRGAGASIFIGNSIDHRPHDLFQQPAAIHLPGFSSSTPLDYANVLSLLPGREAASALIAVYGECVTWMYQATTSENALQSLEVIEEQLDSASVSKPLDDHRLASLFMVLALGTLFSGPEQAPLSPRLLLQATAFCNAATTLLTRPKRHFMAHPSQYAVETIHNQTSFCFCCGDSSASRSGWILLGICLRTAQAVGLHRDPSQLAFSGSAATDRRRLWWEIMTYESLQSLNFGRPYSLPRVLDCARPDLQEQQRELAFHSSKYDIALVFTQISDVLSATELPPYDSILRLDAELRKVHAQAPESLRRELGGDDVDDPVIGPQRHMLALLLHKALLALHRPYFARAMAVEEPMVSSFAASFNVCITSARKHTEIMTSVLHHCPKAGLRWWFFLFHTITSAIIQASALISAPACMLHAEIQHDFDKSINVIRQLKNRSPLADRAMPILERLSSQLSEKSVFALPTAMEITDTYDPQGLQQPGDSATRWLDQYEADMAAGSSSDLGNALYLNPAGLLSQAVPAQDLTAQNYGDPLFETMLQWNASNMAHGQWWTP